MQSVNKSVISRNIIGRDLHLMALDKSLNTVSEGKSQVALVSGEAGIGKSRLVAEVDQRANQRRWLTAIGHCIEADNLFPYAPLINLLRSLLTNYTNDETENLLGPLAPLIVKLLPELALTLPNLTSAAQLDPEAEKRRLFEALVQFFIRLMHQDLEVDSQSLTSGSEQITEATGYSQPLLLIIEDLHWSDDTSLELLRYLARRLTTQPMLLLLTYRNDEQNPSLQHFLATLSRERRPTELILPLLTSLEVDALLRDIFEQEQPIRKEFLDAIFNLTAGNPFFIEEVLKVLIAAGDIFYSDGEWERKLISELHIPYSIQDAVQRRVSQLSQPAVHTLTVAAGIGQQFDFRLLQAVTEIPETDLVTLIKELVLAQLVVELSADQFAFRHALTRQTIYNQLLVRERRTLHLQIAEILERHEATALANHPTNFMTAPGIGLAYHFYEAEAWEQTLTYALRAAKQAQAHITPRAAIEQFTRALHATEQLGQSAILPDLYRNRGLEYEIVGDFDLARADLETVLQLARTAKDRQMEWQAFLDLGKLWASRDYVKAGEYFQEALELSRTLPNQTSHARSLNQMGNWHLNFTSPPQAIIYHEEALYIFNELNDSVGLAQTFDLLGMTNVLGGKPIQGATYCKQAIELFTTLNERQNLVSSLITLSICGPTYTTDTVIPATVTLDECVKWGEQAIKIAREIGWRAGESFSLTMLGQTLASHGQYRRAFSLMHRSIEIAQEIEHRQWICLTLRELATLFLDLMNLSTARQYLEQSMALAQEIGSSHHIRRTTGYLISLSVVEKQFSQVQILLNTTGTLEIPMQTIAQRLIWRGRAELALAQGDSSMALQIVDQLNTSANIVEINSIGAIPDLAHLRGKVLTALQRWSEAEDVLLAGLATAQAQDTPRWVWRIHVALGKLYQAQEQYVKAEESFVNARMVIDAIAANLPDTELRDNFVEQANTMMSPPEPSTPLQAAKQAHGGLTRRERQVAVLIAEGKSNREIAETLVLGVRTVEGHVSNILGKLGFTSRSQIAVWVVETGLLKDKD